MLLELAQQHQLSSNNSPNKRFSQHLYGWAAGLRCICPASNQPPASQCLYEVRRGVSWNLWKCQRVWREKTETAVRETIRSGCWAAPAFFFLFFFGNFERCIYYIHAQNEKLDNNIYTSYFFFFFFSLDSFYFPLFSELAPLFSLFSLFSLLSKYIANECSRRS